MALNTVTLKWSIPDLIQSGLSGTLTITPSAQMSDTTDHQLIPVYPRSVSFSGGTGQLAGIVGNDDAQIAPPGTGYVISVVASNGQTIVPAFTTQILFATGATQWLDELAEVPVVSTGFQYLPLPAGTPTAGQLPAATGHGQASAWETLPANAASASTMLVPGYQYPNPPTFWDELIAAGPDPVRYIVANVSSGPGSSADPNYTAVINAAAAAGIIVLGYVDTDFNAVSLATVQANVGLWQTLYGVTSIFFDRASSDSGDEPYYTTACGYVSGTTVLNHGALPDEGYASIADVLVVYEDVQANWAAFTPPSWFAAYPPSRFAVLVYDAIGTATMAAVMTQAQQYGIGNVYVTDQTGGDPYAAEPSYFAAEIAQALVPLAAYAPLSSPVFTGIPAAPTATALTDSTQIATTAYADAAVAVAEGLALPKAGGTMSGTLNMGSQKITSPGGIDPVTAGFTCFATGGAPQDLNTSSGTSSAMTSGEWFYAALMVPYDCPITGLIFTASVGSGTDKWVCGLFSPAGAPLANSATAGTVTPGSAQKFKIPFTSPVAVAGPSVYIAGVQSNGTTARFLSFSQAVEGFVTGSASGVFGTIPTLSLATTYTANVGPYATTY